jgi:lysophospholipase L1-like esterase
LVLIAAVSAVIAVTCATDGDYRGRARAASAPRPRAAASQSTAPQAPPPAAKQPAARIEPALALPRFYAALGALAAKSAKAPVRVLWLGDSHSAADYLPHGVRTALAARFGPGGPGHLQAGLWPYRHGWADVEVEGTWDREPSSPARARREDDGMFGLGGLRLRPRADARVKLRVKPAAVHGDVRWTILFRTRKGSHMRATLGDRAAVTLSAETSSAGPDGSSIRRFVADAPVSSALELSGAAGDFELFGVIAEGAAPGVVVDTLGINGARVSTPLAWDEASFVAEVRARAPSLAVLAYGTNEASDTRSPEAYADELGRLVGRVRSAVKDIDCLVVGPPDAASRDGGSLPRVAEIEASYQARARREGCAFFSARGVMGGDGSFARWAAEKPPLARPDRVHLTPRGYDRIGAAIGVSLLESYDRMAKR